MMTGRKRKSPAAIKAARRALPPHRLSARIFSRRAGMISAQRSDNFPEQPQVEADQ